MFGFFRDICQRCWPKESLEIRRTTYEKIMLSMCLMAAFSYDRHIINSVRTSPEFLLDSRGRRTPTRQILDVRILIIHKNSQMEKQKHWESSKKKLFCICLFFLFFRRQLWNTIKYRSGNNWLVFLKSYFMYPRWKESVNIFYRYQDILFSISWSDNQSIKKKSLNPQQN